MFICKGKCNSLGLITLINFIASTFFLFYFLICSYNSSNCNVLFIFSLTFCILFFIYLFCWSIDSNKKTRVYPLNDKIHLKGKKNSTGYIYEYNEEKINLEDGRENKKGKFFSLKVSDRLEKNNNSYLYNDNHIEFDQIVI